MHELYDAILELKKAGKEAVLVTCVDKDGAGPAAIGGKMLVTANGYLCGTVGGGAIERYALQKSAELLKERKCLLEKYDLGQNGGEDAKNVGMICGGYTTLFYEFISPGIPVYIFGAGHVGKAIAAALKGLNYHVNVLDCREGIFEGFEGADRTILEPYDQMLEEEGIPEGSYVIIVTHSHVTDYAALKKVFKNRWKPCYIGLLGSTRKAEKFLGQLKEEFGGNIDLSALYSPAGLDLGGDTPAEIAISIISEMQTVRYAKGGHKHLRQ